MIKRLIFVTGFGVGFVVGSASGRKSYEALKQNAVKTWHDPKVQEKVSEGTDWVKSEVPVVGGKLAAVAERVPLTPHPNDHNLAYLLTKRDRMGHVLPGLDLPTLEEATNDVTDQFGRKLSVYLKGKLGKLSICQA